METGWLSPEGKLYECDYMDHRWYGERLVKKFEYETLEDDLDCDDVLYRNGWAKITSSIFHKGKIIFLPKHISIDMREYLKELCESSFEEMDDYTKREMVYNGIIE